MKVFLTGATGFLGSGVLDHLLRDGHAVTALVRDGADSDAGADQVRARGAAVVRGDLRDARLLAEWAGRVHGFIHTGLPGDASSAQVDQGVLDAVLPVLAHTGNTYIHTGGVWIYGSGVGLTGESPYDPPPVVAWRPPLVERVRAAAAAGIHSVVISPAPLYGYGAGIPALLASGPRSSGEQPALLYPGTGLQHVSTVHRDDAAALYALALREAESGSSLLAVNDYSPTMIELAGAASRGQGLDGRIEREAGAESARRLGPLADALALDQQPCNEASRRIGWSPVGPSVLKDLETGSYRR